MAIFRVRCPKIWAHGGSSPFEMRCLSSPRAKASSNDSSRHVSGDGDIVKDATRPLVWARSQMQLKQGIIDDANRGLKSSPAAKAGLMLTRSCAAEMLDATGM
eukprot:2737228-Pyramimonas_sp.AAC.1